MKAPKRFSTISYNFGFRVAVMVPGLFLANAAIASTFDGFLDATEKSLVGVAAVPEDDPIATAFPAIDSVGLPIWNGASDATCTVDGSNLYFKTPNALPCGTPSTVNNPEGWYIGGVVALPPGATGLAISASNEHPTQTPRQSGLHFYSALSDDPTAMEYRGGGWARVNILTRVEAPIPVPTGVCSMPDAVAFRLYVYDESGNHAARFSWKVDGGSDDTAGAWETIPATSLSTLAGFNNDLDGNGIPDYQETDRDADGISDWVESGEELRTVDLDTDGDNTPNCLDDDSDGDGILDSVEGTGDGDGDGVPDFLDTDPNSPVLDKDGDGIEDSVDLDDDNDGIPDLIEMGLAPASGVPGAIDAFPPSPYVFQVINTNNAGQLYVMFPENAEFIAIGGASNFSYNSIGYHEGTNLIYGLALGAGTDSLGQAVAGKDLIVVDVDGEVFRVGSTSVPFTPLAGDIVGDSLWLTQSNGAKAAEVNLTTGATTVFTLSQAFNGLDIAAAGGKFYGVKGNLLYVFDPTAPAASNVSTYTIGGSGAPGAYGATWIATTSAGVQTMYAFRNSSGEIFQIDGFDTATPVSSILLTAPNPAGSNDGARPASRAFIDYLDTDGDGIPDYCDLDSDNDGIADLFESGNAALIAADTDGDGTLSVAEAAAANGGTADADSDGLFDIIDLDPTSTGVADSVDVVVNDTDGDGIPDAQDLDSDGDGISDIQEAGGVDTDGDGLVDGFTDSDLNGWHDATEGPLAANDQDGDGIDDLYDADSDGDGIPDALESGDTDGDGIANHLDIDSDNDGMLDGIEAQVSGTDTDGDGIDDSYDVNQASTNGGAGIDADGDGIDDALELLGILNTDGDGQPDYLDLDSDNDGISDLYESGDAAGIALDADTNGTLVLAEAADTDLDGLLDIFEDGNLATNAGTSPLNSDTDTIADYLDLDSDADTIPDTVEARLTASYLVNDGDVSNDDADGDGIIALFDSNDATPGGFGGTHVNLNAPVNTDGDALPDYLDTNSDDDTETDAQEGESTLAGGSLISTPPSYGDPDGSVNDPLSAGDGSDLLENDDADALDVDYRSTAEAPVVTADSATTAADTDATVNLADNITDANGDADLSTIDLDPSTAGVQSTLTNADGAWSVNASGVVSFDPVASFEGIATIPYTVEDTTGYVSNSANISFTVAGATPVITADTASVGADAIATIDLSDNTSDANNDVDITTIDLDPSTAGVQNTLTTADGVWTVDTAGSLSFDPAPSFEGTATIPYTVSDDDGNVSAPANVSVTVAGATPTVTADTASVGPDALATIDLSDNLSDANNDIDISTIDLDPSTAGVQNTLTTADGVWTVDAAGSLSFDPAPSFEGTATIPYTVSDDDGNVSAPANVSVTVAGAPPVVTADAASVASGVLATIDLSDNLSDANSDVDITTIDLDPSTPGVQSTLTTADGVWTVDAAGSLSFDPAASFEGIASIPYTVSDSNGNVSAPANVSVTVAGATPVVTADTASVGPDALATIDLSDNVSDANDDVVITTIDLDPSTAGVQDTLTTADGVWTVDTAGSLSFDPAASFEGTTTIPYTVSDDDGNVSAPANVSVTVAGATPVVTADAASVAADALATIDLTDNLSDANSDVDITTIDLDPSTAGVQNTLTTADGVWTVDTAGSLSFDPAPAFEGIASIPYTVSDDDGNVSVPANVSVTVAGATPVVTADSATVGPDALATIDLSDNLSDANSDVVITTIDLDTSTPGVQSTLNTPDGVWTVDAAGSLSFDPASNFEGTATIPFTVTDDDGNVSDPANVSVTVAGATPVVTADSASVAADAVASIDLSDNVSDANNDVDITTIDLDPSTAGVQNTLTTADGVWTVDTAGSLSFDPVASFEGTTSIPYTVSDDDGNVSSAATVSVTVAGATPVVTADAATTGADALATIDLSDNASDANNDVDITTIDLDPSTPGVQNTLTTAEGVWAVDTAGLVTFDPEPAFEGAATIPYVVMDDDGNTSAPANVTVTVGGATPIATADAATVLADTNATVDLSDNVSDANNDIDITTIDLDPSTPGVQNTLTTADGVWSVDAAGLVTFDPDPAFEGTATIAYVVMDDDGNTSAPANVTVTVGGATPAATADAATVLADANATVDLSDNVSDANNDADITTIDLDPSTPGVQNTLTTADGEWAVDAAGLVTFDPDPDFEGDATIPYVVMDDDGNTSAPADVTVTVGGATPAATADAATVLADTNATVDLSDNVSDANSDVDLTTIDLDPSTPGVQNTLTTADGVWAVDSAGIVTFDPDPAFEGTATIAYTVADDDGNVSAPANVSVTVGSATPMAAVDAASVLADTNATIDLSDNVTDANNDADISTIDLDPATPGVQNTLTTADGDWSVDAAGMVTFDPDPAFEGAATIAYTVSDAAGNVSAPADITVTVGSADPIADSEMETIVQNMPVTIDVLAGDNDANNDLDPSTIDLDPATPGIQSTLTVTGEGTYEVVAGQVVFTPDAAFFGTSSIDYTVADVMGNVSNVAMVDVIVELDTDGDGVPDVDDIDDDNDGIPDLQEGTNDTDGDGIIDSLDRDSDNDGITDATEAGGSDVDGDGIIDGFTDVDGDGHDDSTGVMPLPAADTDADGLPDYQDLDSDNDGLTDIFEAGGTDSDNDGLVDAFADTDGDGLDDLTSTTPLPLTDSDNDGAADYQDLDSDNDGIPDVTEAGGLDVDGDGFIDNFTDANDDGLDDAIAATPLPLDDFDGDGNPDYLDLDSDNDGITDATEAGVADTDGDGIVDNFTDTDNNGLDDATEATPAAIADTDGDGNADYLDLDSDNDGLTDTSEAGGADTDGDGIVDGFTDVNGDGLDDAIAATPLPVGDDDNDGAADHLDLDSDGDGLTDIFEAGGSDTDGNGIVDGFTDADGDGLDDVTAVTPVLAADFDGDGVPDHLDDDSDNDGIPDAIEAAAGSVDSDGDGQPDHLDLDSDNDGISDAAEAGGTDTDGDGVIDGFTDANGDGMDDATEVVALPVPDSDGDGVVDHLDLDSDNDGIPDVTEAGGTDTDGDGMVDGFSDADLDGLDDATAALPLAGPDTDADGVPDHLDTDSDNDGLTDATEAGGADLDGDGEVDGFADTDGDGLDDSTAIAALPIDDTDGDGTPDYMEQDSDADGIPDSVEAGATPNMPVDTDGDGTPDYLEQDSDNDGIPDTVEAGATPTAPVDTDGDGTPDYLEEDSDNDGIPDTVEAGATPAAPVDTDGDGTPDYLEEDSDNDGIPDTVEAGATPTAPIDTDGDGTPDYLEQDSDNDGIPDNVEAGPAPTAPIDTDGDGTPDYLEQDSDNDGIPDTVEAGATPTAPIDTDGDGTPDYLEEDSDNDGIPDTVEAGATPTAPEDTDGDGTPDYLEQDSDNDGIPDTVEAGSTPTAPVDTDGDGTPDYLEEDSDNDGVPDTVEAGATPTAPVDTDGDGTPDYLEQDSDNDGIPDTVEAGATPAVPVDTDGDGTPDFLEQDSDNDGIPDSIEVGATPASPIDTDGDGTPDYLEADSDNDGIPDSVEAGATPNMPVDTDADGTPDYLEQDSDNDGIPDTVEAGATPAAPIDTDGDGTPDYLEEDSDNDGIPDTVEAGATPAAPIDTDGDGTPDYLEEDSDNDGIPDTVEAGATPAAPIDTDGDGTPDYLEEDSDNDGIPDTVEAGATPTAPVDTDGDGTPDYLEEDSDNDGIPDTVEAGATPAAPIDTDGDGTPDYLEEDSDNDGIPDTVEAGATPAAPVDTDGDGTPDYLEEDSDNDGIPDTVEAGATPTAPIDTDGDGTPDYLEEDSDNDGIPDTVEAGPTPAAPVDTDGDGTPDYLEQDSDNDGIPDNVEAGPAPTAPIDTDGDGTPDYLEQDSDNDGIPDNVEAGPAPAAPVDTDGDGTPDYLEQDSDNDGITDSLEAGPNPTAPIDSDGDGIPDYLELDSDTDGDGISDAVEGTDDTDSDGTADYLDEDSDNDGIPDSIETAVDTDGDGVPDYLDIDADNDGISDALEQYDDTDADGVEDFRDLDVDNDGIYDLIEARIGQVEVVQIDTDNDGIVDLSNPYGANGMADIVETAPDSGEENYKLPDIDGDDVFDFRDLDSDNDGLLDTHESDHDDQNLNGLIDTVGAVRRTVLAVDGSGLASDAGGLPRNTDADGLADFRDGDSDNDGILDVVESFGAALDLNNDGMLDDFVDSNGDGVDDDWQAAPSAPVDTDNDGLADAQEIDSDGDGITDLIESGGTDADGTGTIDGFSDSDGDGIDDAVAAVPSALIDTDGDGSPDYQDLDSDNDGLSDLLETGGTDADGDGQADALALAAALPDSDGDGIPDFQELPPGVDPINPDPLEPAPATGLIHTGLAGSGCAIPETLGAQTSTRVDPTLPLLTVLSLLGLALRRRLLSVVTKENK